MFIFTGGTTIPAEQFAWCIDFDGVVLNSQIGCHALYSYGQSRVDGAFLFFFIILLLLIISFMFCSTCPGGIGLNSLELSGVGIYILIIYPYVLLISIGLQTDIYYVSLCVCIFMTLEYLFACNIF
jgi:hypothetical protein